MKEKKYIYLQIVCGDIIDVDIVGGNFVINTTQQIVQETLEKVGNQKILNEAFAWQDLKFNIIINRVLTKEDEQKEDFEKLKILGITFKKEGKNE